MTMDSKTFVSRQYTCTQKRKNLNSEIDKYIWMFQIWNLQHIANRIWTNSYMSYESGNDNSTSISHFLSKSKEGTIQALQADWGHSWINVILRLKETRFIAHKSPFSSGIRKLILSHGSRSNVSPYFYSKI